MNNFWEYIRKNNFGLLFLFLEVIAVTITSVERQRPKLFFLNSSNFVVSSVYSLYYSFYSYVGLKKDNEMFVEEIINLKNNCPKNFRYVPEDRDTIKKYAYIEAHVINNTIDKQNNFLTIDKGRKDGVREGDAVISYGNAVGVVVNVSNHYAVALSLLNTMSGVSAEVKRTKHWGSVIWDGKNYNYALLEGIPNHIKLYKNDTIVTSSYSTIFPEGITIGYIDTLWKNNEDNFYTIKIRLATDFKSVKYVLIVKNLHGREIKDIETQTEEIYE